MIGYSSINRLSPINRRHPLARGLKYFFLPDPRGGSHRMENLADYRYPATLLLGAAQGPSGSRLPGGLLLDGVDSCAVADGATFPYRPCTVFSIVRIDSDTAGNQMMIARGAVGEVDGGFVTHKFTGTSPPQFGITFFGVGSESYPVGWEFGQWQFFCTAMKEPAAAATQPMWHHYATLLSGEPLVSETEHTPQLNEEMPVGTPRWVYIGGYPVFGSWTPPGAIYATGVWDRYVPHGEVRMLLEESRIGFPNLLNRAVRAPLAEVAAEEEPAESGSSIYGMGLYDMSLYG